MQKPAPGLGQVHSMTAEKIFKITNLLRFFTFYVNIQKFFMYPAQICNMHVTHNQFSENWLKTVSKVFLTSCSNLYCMLLLNNRFYDNFNIGGGLLSSVLVMFGLCRICNGSSFFLFLCVQISECYFSWSFNPIDFKPWYNDPQVLRFYAMTFLRIPSSSGFYS